LNGIQEEFSPNATVNS